MDRALPNFAGDVRPMLFARTAQPYPFALAALESPCVRSAPSRRGADATCNEQSSGDPARPSARALASEAMVRYAAGDDRAFDALYAVLAPRLIRTCILLVGHAEADDLLQEVFLKIHRARAAFVPGGNVIAWSLAIARTTSIDRMRRRRGRERATDAVVLEQRAATDMLSPEGEARCHALSVKAEAALMTLSEPLRAAYVLVRFEELSCSEAAVVLGTTTNAIKQRIHRAQDALKRMLSPTD